jgi:hypothetical protein
MDKTGKIYAAKDPSLDPSSSYMKNRSNDDHQYQWVLETIDLQDYLEQNIQLRFLLFPMVLDSGMAFILMISKSPRSGRIGCNRSFRCFRICSLS